MHCGIFQEVFMCLCTLSWRVATLLDEVDVFPAGTGVDFLKTLFFK